MTDPSGSAPSQVVESDVIVVGAGPGGATAARHLANRGLTVSLLEKSTFPRDKVCGDGLTPRAVKQLIRLGIDVSTEAGWVHNHGLRVHGGRVEPFVLPWPELNSFPNFGVVKPRARFDDLLARHAVAGGADLFENTTVTEPIWTTTGSLGSAAGTDGCSGRR